MQPRLHLRSRAWTATIAAAIVAMVALLATAPVVTGEPPTSSPRAAGDLRLAAVPGASFQGPVWVGSAPGSGATYYVVEQRGLVWAVTGRRAVRYLDLRSSVLASGEQGLLSIAFAADHATSGRLWAYYVARDGAGEVRQFRARDGRIVAGSGRRTIRFALSPPAATNHNGGNLWAMRDGSLLLSVGDGGGGGVERRNSQRLDNLMGKLVRITPRANGGYAIPASNPFVGRAGARGEIYALGLRNPWRFSVDAPTGDVWIGDVGQGAQEEVDRLARSAGGGANFGWPRMEGTALFSSDVAWGPGRRTAPVHTYSHAGGRCSITGGLVYRGPVRALRGLYLYADFCADRVWSMVPSTRRVTSHPGVPGIVHFGEVAGGSVLAASATTGRIYRVLGRA